MPLQFYLIVYCNQECLFFGTNKELYLNGRKPIFPDHALIFSRVPLAYSSSLVSESLEQAISQSAIKMTFKQF